MPVDIIDGYKNPYLGYLIPRRNGINRSDYNVYYRVCIFIQERYVGKTRYCSHKFRQKT